MSAAMRRQHHQAGTAEMDRELQCLRAAEKAAHARYLRLSRRGGVPALDEATIIAEDLWRDAAEAVRNY
jgi:hypothetical protein